MNSSEDTDLEDRRCSGKNENRTDLLGLMDSLGFQVSERRQVVVPMSVEPEVEEREVTSFPEELLSVP